MTGPTRAVPTPVTLDDLARAGRLVWAYCSDCDHERDLDPIWLPVAGATPVPDLARQLKCAECGSRKITTKPELCPGVASTHPIELVS